MGTRPEDLAARASQLESDADGIRTQNERKLAIDDAKQRIEATQDRLAGHEVRAAQNRVVARELREQATKLKREVAGERDPADRFSERSPVTGENARAQWRAAQENERRAAALEKTAEESEAAAAEARVELEQYETQLQELEQEYNDAKLMDPYEGETPAPLPQGDFVPGTGPEVASLLASDELADGDALAAQVEMAAAGADPLAPEDGTLDGDNPEHPGFGPTPEDPTIDVETPEDPGFGPTPEDPTIDVETPEVPDIPLPEPEPEPEVPNTGDGGMDFESA